MPQKNWQAHTRDDLIREVWATLAFESVGKHELECIQHALRQRYGEGAVESPASIARTLAEHGAKLRHPEVLDFDTKWREERLLQNSLSEQFSFSTLGEAKDSIRRLDSLRRTLEQEKQSMKLTHLRELVLGFKREAQLLAGSKIVTSGTRVEATEIAHWLSVWLQDPNLFEDWLSLRQRSPGFVQLLRQIESQQ
jgi:hypothetical protein